MESQKPPSNDTASKERLLISDLIIAGLQYPLLHTTISTFCQTQGYHVTPIVVANLPCAGLLCHIRNSTSPRNTTRLLPTAPPHSQAAYAHTNVCAVAVPALVPFSFIPHLDLGTPRSVLDS